MPRLEEITAGNLDAAIAVSVRPDQEHAVDPEGFYRALGFRTSGEMSGHQVVGELPLA